MTREDVQAEARKWLDVPYRKRGRSSGGIDCIGLLVVVGRAFAVPHEEHEYSDWPNPDHMALRVLGRYLTPLPPSTPLPGLVGVFAERRLPGHIGFFTEKHGAPHLLHARIRPGVVSEESWSQVPHGELRLIGLFGFPGLEL